MENLIYFKIELSFFGLDQKTKMADFSAGLTVEYGLGRADPILWGNIL